MLQQSHFSPFLNFCTPPHCAWVNPGEETIRMGFRNPSCAEALKVGVGENWFVLLTRIICTSWYGRYPIIYRVSCIPGGTGFLPSTVLLVAVEVAVVSSCDDGGQSQHRKCGFRQRSLQYWCCFRIYLDSFDSFLILLRRSFKWYLCFGFSLPGLWHFSRDYIAVYWPLASGAPPSILYEGWMLHSSTKPINPHGRLLEKKMH